MKVFLSESIHQDALVLLKNHFEIINQIEKIQECEIILSRNLHLNQNILKKCTSLQLIAIHGTGYDDVDIEYAKNNGIHLVHTPGENAQSVAEMIITLMLELSRKIIPLHKYIEDHSSYEVAPIEFLGSELYGKTFGMIGTGKIALKAAMILKNGFHMNVIGYSRSLTPQKALDFNIGYCDSLNEVFKTSDYISIGTSLTDDTYHMIGKEQFSLMKPSAYLINTSRGAIINENDLYTALKNHWFAGAGLDVLENEPILKQNPLLSLDNIIYTSHMGASTEEALKRVSIQTVQNIIDFSYGRKLKHLVF